MLPPGYLEEVSRICDGSGSKCSGVPGEVLAREALSAQAAEDLHQGFAWYFPRLTARLKLLMVGCNFGGPLLHWARLHGYDVWASELFSDQGIDSHHLARQLLGQNGLDASQVQPRTSPELSFDDGSFHLVYAAAALDESSAPEKLMSECLRVLQVGGVAQFVISNQQGFYSEVYGGFQPPYLHPWLLSAWVRSFGKDPGKASRPAFTPRMIRKAVARLQGRHSFKVVSFGDELFAHRMKKGHFGSVQALNKLNRLAKFLGNLGLADRAAGWICRLGLQHQVVLTVEKTEAAGGVQPAAKLCPPHAF